MNLPFRLRDMLVPGPLLDCTNWRDNPLVVYSQRRSRRPVRFVLMRLLELILLAIGTVAIIAPFEFRIGSSDYFPMLRNDSGWTSRFPLFLAEVIPTWSFVLAFFLLRYHLLINDQAHHIKTLSREKLAELLLTRLGSDDFFLHHFLLFCHRYRVVVAWAVIWGVVLFSDIVSGGFEWVKLETLLRILATLNIVLLTWVLGVHQYVTEWQMYAGGRAVRWRPALSMLHSIGLTFLICIASMPWFVYGGGPAMITMLAAFPIALVVTCRKGQWTAGVATDWLTRRYFGEEPIARHAIRLFDPVCPWRWISPFNHAHCDPNRPPVPWKAFLRSIPYVLIFFVLANVSWLVRVPVFSPYALIRPFVMAMAGIWLGIYLGSRRNTAGLRASYMHALWWIGVIYCVSFVSLSLYYNRFARPSAGPVNPATFSAFYYTATFFTSYIADLSRIYFAVLAGVLLSMVRGEKWRVLQSLGAITLPAALAFAMFLTNIYLVRYPQVRGSWLGYMFLHFVYAVTGYLVPFWILLFLLKPRATSQPAAAPASLPAP